MRIALFIILLLISEKALSQGKSDLYLHVDSLIKFDLKFDPRSPQAFYDSFIKGMDPAKVYIMDTMHLIPLIIVNGYVVDNIQKLNKGTLANVTKIMVLKSPESASLYGYRGVFGVIIITGKRKLSRKILRG